MKTVHIVPHTHWDREWYLTFQQFRLKLVHLLDGLLDLLAADANYPCFVLDGQTIVLDDYLAMRGERRSEIETLVRAGRLLIGPFHILPDEFLVSPEATIRNLLEGERTAQQFGAKMRVGYIPDPFGHIGQMPQILRGFGIDRACLTRGLADEPCELRWEAADGSWVLLSFQRNSYGNAAGLVAADPALFTAGVRDAADALAPYSAAADLLLAYGTDHQEPQRETPAAIAAAQAALRGDGYHPIHSTLPAYFDALAASLDPAGLPVVSGELRACKRHPLLPGVLSARMWIKQRNRQCETLLEKWAEPFSVWAERAVRGAVGEAGPAGRLRRSSSLLRPAWRLLMECHPHDSICGCSIDQVHAEMVPRFDQVEQIGEEITRQCLAAIAEAVDTRPAAEAAVTPIVVFNPSGFVRSDVVTVEAEPPPGCGGFELRDETGAPLPYDTEGLGSRQLIAMRMSRKEFRVAVATLSAGNVAGMKLTEMSVTRAGDEAFVEVVLSEQGAANLEAWARGTAEIAALLDDPGVTDYVVRARSVSAVKVTFVAAGVPACGYRSFWAEWKSLAQAEPASANPLLLRLAPVAMRLGNTAVVQRSVARVQALRAGRAAPRIENDFLAVELGRDGALTVTDRRTGAVYAGLNRFSDGGDCGDEYNYAPPATDRVVGARLRSVEVISGGALQSIEARLEINTPVGLASDRGSRAWETVRTPVVTRISLAAGVPRVDIHTEIDNGSRDHRLRVHFPLGAAVDTAEYDGHFELVRRSTALPPHDETWVEEPRPEAPQRAFVLASGGGRGLLVANRGLPEASVSPDGEIAVTLLRCVGWLSRDDFSARKGHAGPALETPGAQMPGKWSFDYSVVPFAPAGKLAGCQAGWAFGTPLRAVSTTVHGGRLPPALSFLRVEPQEFLLSAVKAAEDGRGWIARGYNAGGETIEATLTTWEAPGEPVRVNVAEEACAGAIAAQGRTVTLSVRGHEIASVRLGAQAGPEM